jgi:hypothetical protein
MNTVHQQKKEHTMKREHMPLSSVMVMTKGAIMLVVMLLALLYPLTQEGIAETRTMTIIHTNNITGHLFPCPT